LIQLSANIVLLDRGLAHYGPEAKEARDSLRDAVTTELYTNWPESRAVSSANLEPATAGLKVLYDKIQKLEPHNEVQRSVKVQLLTMAVNLAQTRWLLFEQGDSSIPIPFLVVLVFWFSIIFISFGIFAPPNATMFVALLLAALSVSGAILLILELDQPFAGLIRLSSVPLRNALAHLGQ